jgi:glycerophosphoryl diester phosphodiesterase
MGCYLGTDLAPSTLEKLLTADNPAVVGIEIDCVLTSDGDLILLHDNHLDETTTLAGWAREHTSAAITQSYLTKDGVPTVEHPMSLDELYTRLQAYARPILLQVEAKAYQNAAEAEQVVRVLDKKQAPENVSLEVISFWPGACELAASLGYRARYIANASRNPASLIDWAADHGLAGFVLEHPYLDPTMLSYLAQRGLSWTSGNLNHRWQYDLLLDLPLLPEAVCTDDPLGLLS